MLLGAGQRVEHIASGVDSVHNYYENLVLVELQKTSERSRTDGDFLADAACVALNRLPPRYIRHDVDMTFFMSTQELAEIEEKVSKAVSDAIAYVEEREAARAMAEQPQE
ncbi:MAG: hypothetical protein AseanaTS_16840 [Candidatus Pelagadaptatus aseana]|uniref:late competence development ComFB family protein n=1 Tax=Candidatus Pelagadaptatus aseana TaxID=3120508 RepID=UPI0039B20C55